VYALLDCNPHYVRCVKSNDQKSAGLFDAQRVLHQSRYLGLLENVKVRRAGFALRIEFHRFIHRFKVLAAGQIDPRVLATGTDYDIAYAILDAAAYQVEELKKQGEAQLGRTKVFIKSPETFAALQDMRKKLVSEQVMKIQNVWRKFSNRRELVDLRTEMTDLWSSQGKAATAADLLRPYHAFYIKDRELTEAISALLELYQLSEVKKEKLEYTEILNKLNASGTFSRVVLFITDQAMYHARWIPDANNPPPKIPKGMDPRQAARLHQKHAAQVKHTLFLQRRTELKHVSGILLSREADDFICIQVQPQDKNEKPDKSMFLDKKKVKRCMETQQPFTFFGKSKHQCAYTGGVYVKEAMTKLPGLPDKGFFGPVEVHNSVPGTVSLEMREDVVLQTEKKAELVAVLRNLVTMALGGKRQDNKFDTMALKQAMPAASKPLARALFDYTATQADELDLREGDVIELLQTDYADWWTGTVRGKAGMFPASYTERIAAPASHKPKRANPKRYKLAVIVDNDWVVRAAPIKALSHTFPGKIQFIQSNKTRDVVIKKSSGKLTISVPEGVAGQKLQLIQRNQAARAARREEERQKIMELRRENAAQREAQRRADREVRLAAKKDRRREEKLKREKEQNALNFGAKQALKGGASFKERLARQNGSANARSGGSVTAKAPSWVTSRSNGSAASDTPKWDRKSFQRPAAAKPKVTAKLKEIWEAYQDDDSGDLYWFNPSTGESSWDEPRGNVQIIDHTDM